MKKLVIAIAFTLTTSNAFAFEWDCELGLTTGSMHCETDSGDGYYHDPDWLHPPEALYPTLSAFEAEYKRISAKAVYLEFCYRTSWRRSYLWL
jgi:hypothetical protein